MRVTASENASMLVEQDGPTLIRRAGREETVDRVRIALCRCGSSTSKPYCDMTHLQAGFTAARTELAPERSEQEVRVRITSMENGPNKVEAETGTWRVVRDGSEETIERSTIFLCRCGHSENKPFCDGTHRKVGFVAPLYELELEPA